MSEARVNFDYCDQLVEKFEQVCEHPIKSTKKEPIYYTGVDLGTACVVVAVLDENFEPVAVGLQFPLSLFQQEQEPFFPLLLKRRLENPAPTPAPSHTPAPPRPRPPSPTATTPR